MKFWLMKSEPDEYGIADLERDRITVWTGVRNYQARNFMRDMKLGDKVLFYHSNAGKLTGIAGVGEIVKESYPDPSQFDKNGNYFDAKSSTNNARWSAVDLEHVSSFVVPLLLSEIRNISELAGMKLLQKGSRLSVTPVKKEEYDFILKTATKK